MMVTNLKLIRVARNFSIQRLRKPDGIVYIGLEKLVWGGGVSLLENRSDASQGLK
jgi:hypothetical protein